LAFAVRWIGCYYSETPLSALKLLVGVNSSFWKKPPKFIQWFFFRTSGERKL